MLKLISNLIGALSQRVYEWKQMRRARAIKASFERGYRWAMDAMDSGLMNALQVRIQSDTSDVFGEDDALLAFDHGAYMCAVDREIGVATSEARIACVSWSYVNNRVWPALQVPTWFKVQAMGYEQAEIGDEVVPQGGRVLQTGRTRSSDVPQAQAMPPTTPSPPSSPPSAPPSSLYHVRQLKARKQQGHPTFYYVRGNRFADPDANVGAGSDKKGD